MEQTTHVVVQKTEEERIIAFRRKGNERQVDTGANAGRSPDIQIVHLTEKTKVTDKGA